MGSLRSPWIPIYRPSVNIHLSTRLDFLLNRFLVPPAWLSARSRFAPQWDRALIKGGMDANPISEKGEVMGNTRRGIGGALAVVILSGITLVAVSPPVSAASRHHRHHRRAAQIQREQDRRAAEITRQEARRAARERDARIRRDRRHGKVPFGYSGRR
jgi:hypothetical protein